MSAGSWSRQKRTTARRNRISRRADHGNRGGIPRRRTGFPMTLWWRRYALTSQSMKPRKHRYGKTVRPCPLLLTAATTALPDVLGVGGAKEKFRNNMAAIRLLHDLQIENRLATPEEQETLAKYVDGAVCRWRLTCAWANEYKELKSALSMRNTMPLWNPR